MLSFLIHAQKDHVQVKKEIKDHTNVVFKWHKKQIWIQFFIPTLFLFWFFSFCQLKNCLRLSKHIHYLWISVVIFVVHSTCLHEPFLGFYSNTFVWVWNHCHLNKWRTCQLLRANPLILLDLGFRSVPVATPGKTPRPLNPGGVICTK